MRNPRIELTGLVFFLSLFSFLLWSEQSLFLSFSLTFVFTALVTHDCFSKITSVPRRHLKPKRSFQIHREPLLYRNKLAQPCPFWHSDITRNADNLHGKNAEPRPVAAVSSQVGTAIACPKAWTSAAPPRQGRGGGRSARIRGAAGRAANAPGRAPSARHKNAWRRAARCANDGLAIRPTGLAADGLAIRPTESAP